MKRMLVLIVGAALTLSGCEAMFDINLFTAVDTPPKLDNTKLTTSSTGQIEKMLSPTFYTQLKTDTAALQAVKTNLLSTMNSTSSTVTAAQKAEAAQVFIQVAANATGALSVVNNLVTAALPQMSSGNFQNLASNTSNLQQMTKDLFAGQTTEEIKKTLTSFAEISTALNTLQSSATSAASGSTSTVSDVFFGDSNKGEVAQIGLVSTVASVLLSSATGSTTDAKADAVVQLINAPDTTSAQTIMNNNFNSNSLTTSFTEIGNAVSNNTTSSNYSYLNTLVSSLGLPKSGQ